MEMMRLQLVEAQLDCCCPNYLELTCLFTVLRKKDDGESSRFIYVLLKNNLRYNSAHQET